MMYTAMHLRRIPKYTELYSGSLHKGYTGRRLATVDWARAVVNGTGFAGIRG